MSEKQKDNIVEAKKSIKYHIKFLQALLKHLNGADPILQDRAGWASWCLHRYMNDRLVSDIEKAMNDTENKVYPH
jgi:hypothetical protein